MRQYKNDIEQAVVEITNRCNLRCPHCASASGAARKDEMSLPEIRKLMRDLAGLGCRMVTLLGGEFLLRPDWYDVAKTVKDAGMRLNLITNGILVSEEVRKQFKALEPAAVGVSIDGATPESYRAVRGVDGYAKCRRLLDELVEDGIRQVNAITTFSSRNLGDFDSFVADFTGRPFVWQVQLVHRAGERFDESLLLTKAQYEWYVERVTRCIRDLNGRLNIRTMDDFGYFPLTPDLAFLCQIWDGCPAGRRVIGVRANGDVLPCLSLGSEFVEDNIRRRTLACIWRDPNSFARFRNKTDRDLTGKCAKCPMAGKCRAGCSAAAISTSGRLSETCFCIRQLETARILNDMLVD
ncbi:MAG: radical SAM protein [Kiritimatiellae bacterium]|nr:radical SAM protein [Kiritimatiellia bacterium]